jgi:hypothetical protein
MSEMRGQTLIELQREYLATSTAGMPIGGLIAWAALALISWQMGDAMPAWVAFTAAAAPVPLSIVIDKLRGAPGLSTQSNKNPLTQLFMRFIFVIALIIPFVIFAAQAAKSIELLILGLAILAGMIWVPHGWCADDRAGMIHFILRAALCYAAYVFVPEPHKAAAIAGAAALTYVYAIWAMKKPDDARRH